MVLEDSSGRIRIKNTDKVKTGDFITGSIVGFKGSVDQNGLFVTTDYTYAGFNPEHFLPIPDSIQLN